MVWKRAKEKSKQAYPHNRDGMWEVMREYKRFTIDDIALELHLDKSSVKSYVASLVKGGFITLEQKTDGSTTPNVFALKKDVGRHRPELNADGTAKPVLDTQKMWMAMKVMPVFNFMDVSLTARVDNLAAKNYCLYLRRAGYLRVVDKAKSGNHGGRPEAYSFNKSRDTGYYAPQIRRVKSVYDRNLKKVVWPEAEAA